MKKYDLRQMTNTRLSEVADDWKAAAGEDEFEVELAAVFDWCATHLSPKVNDSHAMELVDEATGKTEAVLEVITAHRGLMSKMLKIYVSPHYWAADSDVELKKDAIALFTAAFILMLRNGIVDGVQEVKIYGRTNEMMTILTALKYELDEKIPGWTTTLAGRWLSVVPKV